MLIDDIQISLSAGNGGKGAVAFNKNLMSLGPAGGSGGKGGSVYFEGVSDLSKLNQFRYKKEVKAEDGMDGRSQFRDGKDGKDLIIQVPFGTVIHDLDKNTMEEITSIGQKILMAKGGRGGKGNFHFRSPSNTSPKEFEEGKPGDFRNLRLELKMVADVGFIGLPNAGKSSLLNELTNAKAKVANYAFTTLEPNLGAYYDLILADIPGLIEGASLGKGLGIKFLRHIERTKELFHLISAESDNPIADYKSIRAELKKHSEELAKKPESVFLSKSDEISEEELNKKIKAFKDKGIKIEPISILYDNGLEPIKKALARIADNKKLKA
ncbi:MAG: GTPase ObgE [Candidatus Paceibacterota bacterium]